MSDSDSSGLSSPPASDDEKLAPIFLKARAGKKTVKKSTQSKKSNGPPPTPPSPPRPKREPSPEHEETIADNPDISFIVMFRSRFSAAFPPKVPHLGPQDIERGIVDTPPSAQVENVLCALLALALNRKKPIERGHHGRALEEAISSNKHQWPKSWNYQNPLPGTKTFNDLDTSGRLNMLRTLIMWSMTTSEEISKILKDSYKQTRHEDDLNQPLSVQSWGQDDDKRRYYLVEGQDDTSFRLYREGNRALKNISWRNMAGTIDEVKAVADHLKEKHHSQASRRLATRIDAAIPRFEITEDKRRRREFRQIRKQQFTRPEPGFSLYEGRTRGKRMRYTFDDNDEDELDSDAPSTRRSGRNNSNGSTPVESGPTITASGRTVRPRGGGGMYGESLLSGQASGVETGSYAASETSDAPNGRATRAGRRASNGGAANGNRKRKYHDDGMSEESDNEDSGNEWEGGDDFEDEKDDGHDSADDDEDDLMLDDDEDELSLPSLVVKLKVGKGLTPAAPAAPPIDSKPTLPQAEDKPPPEQNTSLDQQAVTPAPTDIPSGTVDDAKPSQPSLKQEPPQAVPQPQPVQDNMDIDPPKVTQLEHPLPLELSANGDDETILYPSHATAGLHSHPPVPPAQANGWS